MILSIPKTIFRTTVNVALWPIETAVKMILPAVPDAVVEDIDCLILDLKAEGLL